jgi:hypothetical protein
MCLSDCKRFHSAAVSLANAVLVGANRVTSVVESLSVADTSPAERTRWLKLESCGCASSCPRTVAASVLKSRKRQRKNKTGPGMFAQL